MALPGGLVCHITLALHLFDVRDVIAVLSGSSAIASSPGGAGGGSAVVRISGPRSTSMSKGSSSDRSDGVTDLVNNSVPDVVVQLDVLALTDGAIKEVHWISCQT